MRKLVIRGMAAVLVAFALVACTTSEPDVISTFEFDMSYAHATTIVAPSTGKGSAKVELNETKKTVTVTGSYADLSAPATVAHIHGPAAKGSTGGAVVTLDIIADPAPTVAVVGVNSGKISVESETLTDEQIADMKAGMHYINIHTGLNPGGEVRGQINNDSADTIVTYVVNLAAVGNDSTATGKAVATLNKTAKTATLIGTYSGLTGAATMAHIHEGVTNTVVLPLAVQENPTAAGSGGIGFPTSPVTDAQIAAMEAGVFYINIHTDANPGGEIRGDIK